MRKHCGNCANHRKETNQFSEACSKCVAAVLENGERTDPSHWREKPMTNADRIRAMSDAELAEHLYYGFDVQYCHNSPECAAMLDTDEGIPEAKCKGCALEWLQQPAEGD